MSDFEDRLGAALSESAEDAPGAGGLAAGARTRAGARRRRRMTVGVAVAVLAIVVPLGVVRGLDQQDAGDSGVEVVATSDDGWQTVAFDYEPPVEDEPPGTLLVEVPADWVDVPVSESCPGFYLPGSYRWGAPDRADPCDEAETMTFQVDGGNLDFTFGPGLRPATDYDQPVGFDWIGRVSLDHANVSVFTDDQQLALRVLGSTRDEEEGAPDLSGEWTTQTADGISYPAPPASAGPVEVAVTDTGGSVESSYGEQTADGRWLVVTELSDGSFVRVTAPTWAIAVLVAGSARRSTDEVDWVTVTVADVSIDVPPGWRRGECRFGFPVLLPPDATSCSPGAPRVTFLLEAAARFPGPFLRGDSGAVLSGDQIVGASGLPFETTRRILASARPAGTPAPDVATWRTIDAGDGVTAVVPDDDRVEVVVSTSVPSCAAEQPRSAQLDTDGRWTIGRCGNHIVTVTAPTQALTDVVAAQIEGW